MAFGSDSVRVFLAVLDNGSFSAAARALGRAPSAVSMAIANLEAEIDLALFDRSGREPTPTAAARALEPQARRIALGLRQLDAHALALHAGLERRLVVAIASELLSAAWDAPLAELAEAYPELDVDIRSGPMDDMMALLHAGEAQLAMVYERPRLDDREAFQEFSQAQLTAVAAPLHPLAAADRRPRMSDLIDARQIAVAGRARSHADARILLSRSLWRTESHLATLRLVRQGLGWAFVPKAMAAAMLAAGELVELAFEDMSNDLRLWVDVVWRNDRPLGLAARRYLVLLPRRAGGG